LISYEKKGYTKAEAFRMVDLSSDERTKLEDQIMERALALWRGKQGRRLSPFSALSRAESEALKSKLHC
jgi:hypothetical protein